jgi:hypothetical protein
MRRGSRAAVDRPAEGREAMNDTEHPKGALLFMLVYLLIMAVLWTNAYLRLWGG